MPNINEMLSKINQAGGLARQNKYTVTIPIATLLKNANTISGATGWNAMDGYDPQFGLRLTAFCAKSELPSVNLQTEIIGSAYGPVFKIPHRVEFSDMTMTFFCGDDMLERYFFDSWMYMIADPYSNDFNYLTEFAVDIEIVQYSETASSDVTLPARYVTTLIDAYPIAIARQDLAYDADNTVQKIEVTFTFKKATWLEDQHSTSATVRQGSTLFSANQVNPQQDNSKYDYTITPK